MINVRDPSQLRRLVSATERSREDLGPFRDKRLQMLKQYVGTHYGEGTTGSNKIPINLLEQAISIYARALISSNPATIITSPYRELKPSAAMLQLATNNAIRNMNLERSLRLWVMEAMFGLGVMKVGLTRSKSNSELDPGQVYARVVPFDDYVHDTSAMIVDECRFFGNRYRIAEDDLRSDPRIDWKKANQLPRVGQTLIDDQGEERSQSLSVQGTPDNSELEDQFELYDIYLVRENVLVTVHLPTATLLNVVHFDGPLTGPYHLLGFGDVPGNLMPLSPASLLLDLHDIANRLGRKLARQSERQKTVTTYSGGSEDDAERLRRSNDGDTVRVDRSGQTGEVSMGGANPKTHASFLQFKQLFSQMGGNIEALGGLGPQSDTLGQDQIISTGANQRLQEMQERFLTATRRVCRDIAWYGWTDRLSSPTLSRRLPGTDMEIPVAWTPEERRGNFLDNNIDIDAYSMGANTPAKRLQSLVTFVEKFVIPMLPLAQAQGITLDIEPVLREAAACLGRRDVDTLLRFTAGAQNPSPGPIGPTPTTQSTYTRVSRSAPTSQGQERSMMRQMLGENLQPSEVDMAAGT